MLATHAGLTSCLEVAARAEKQTFTEPEERQRVAAILRGLAARDRAGTTILEKIGATSCLVRAARLAGDEGAAVDAQLELDEVREDYRGGEVAHRSLLALGVPSLAEELAARAPDEARFFHELSRLVRKVRAARGGAPRLP